MYEMEVYKVTANKMTVDYRIVHKMTVDNKDQI